MKSNLKNNFKNVSIEKECNGMSCQFFTLDIDKHYHTEVLHIKFKGEYREGSLGKPELTYLTGMIQLGIDLWRPKRILIDIKNVTYTYGDDMMELLNFNFPNKVILLSNKNIRAITTLWFDDHYTEASIIDNELFFEDYDKAVEKLLFQMNVIEYLQDKTNYNQLFESTFNTPLESYHLNIPSGEASINVYIIKKETDITLEKALMLSVVQGEAKDDYYCFKDATKKEILDRLTTDLKEHYKDSVFCLSKSTDIAECMESYQPQGITRVYKNANWEDTLALDDILKMDWIQEESIKTYQLKSVWNDQDFLFETANYFIRYNWGTSA